MMTLVGGEMAGDNDYFDINSLVYNDSLNSFSTVFNAQFHCCSML